MKLRKKINEIFRPMLFLHPRPKDESLTNTIRPVRKKCMKI